MGVEITLGMETYKKAREKDYFVWQRSSAYEKMLPVCSKKDNDRQSIAVRDLARVVLNEEQGWQDRADVILAGLKQKSSDAVRTSFVNRSRTEVEGLFNRFKIKLNDLSKKLFGDLGPSLIVEDIKKREQQTARVLEKINSREFIVDVPSPTKKKIVVEVI